MRFRSGRSGCGTRIRPVVADVADVAVLIAPAFPHGVSHPSEDSPHPQPCRVTTILGASVFVDPIRALLPMPPLPATPFTPSSRTSSPPRLCSACGSVPPARRFQRTRAYPPWAWFPFEVPVRRESAIRAVPSTSHLPVRAAPFVSRVLHSHSRHPWWTCSRWRGRRARGFPRTGTGHPCGAGLDLVRTIGWEPGEPRIDESDDIPPLFAAEPAFSAGCARKPPPCDDGRTGSLSGAEVVLPALSS
jgi:hypothetical protein